MRVTVRKTKNNGSHTASFTSRTSRVVVFTIDAGSFMTTVLPNEDVKFVRVAFNPKEFGEDTLHEAKRALARKEVDGWQIVDMNNMLDTGCRIESKYQVVALKRPRGKSKEVPNE